MIPSNKPSRFAIVGTQRTGTSLIRTALSSHPDVLCHGEVFKSGNRPYSLVGGYWEYSRRSVHNRLRSFLHARNFTRDYLAQLYSAQAYDAIGLKLMLNQCKRRPYIWPLLMDLGVKMVLVRRRNVLKTLVSRRAAEASGVYHVSRTLQTASAVTAWVPQKIQLNMETLIHDLIAIESEVTEWRERLRKCAECIEVVYEDYVETIDEGNRTILAFLGVRQLDLQSDLQKVNPDQIGQLVSNYEMVATTLRGSRYAECLDTN